MAVTYDFQTPGVSTSAADTQEDIRNIAEAAATGFNSSHTLSNIPTGAWRMESILTAANWQFYNGSSWDDMRFAKLHVYNNGLVLVNEIGVYTLEYIAMGDTPGYVTSESASWFIQSDFLSAGTTTFDPILGFMNQGTERARIYTDTSDSHKLKFDVGGSDQMVIDSSGKVGIGTSSPSSLLEVSNVAGNPVISITADALGVSDLNLGDENDLDVGRIRYAHAINSMIFNTNAAERMRITSDGDVELSKLAGRSYSLPSVTSVNPNFVTGTNFNNIPVQVGDEITFYNNQVRTVTAVTNTQLTVDQNWTTSFAATSATGKAGIGFNTKDTERMRITADGNVEVNTGNLVIGTSGKGIDFSATSGTGTSELLDDYEEGTFTPTYTTTAVQFSNVSYDVQNGSYTKIGRQVFFTLRIQTSSITVGSASGNIRISGLPFPASSTSSIGRSAVAITESTGFSGDVPSSAYIFESQAVVYLMYRSNSNSDDLDLIVSDLGTGSNSNQITLSGTYQI